MIYLLDLSLWSWLLDQVLQGLEDPEKVLDQAVDEMQVAWPGIAGHSRAWPGTWGSGKVCEVNQLQLASKYDILMVKLKPSDVFCCAGTWVK